MRTIFITGGAGFIGSALVRLLLAKTDYAVLNIDKLTYAANPASLADVEDSGRYRFELADICDASRMRALFAHHQPCGVIHLAAESHVDRSIDAPDAFIQTNVVGTFTLLSESLAFWRTSNEADRAAFRFVHVSTDEVYGSLPATGVFTEQTAYDPRSPYAASKAAADHLARAWHHTYGLPVITTNSSNNYGPCQFPEKLIPLAILSALANKRVPVYGNGEQVRDWLFVDDHATALRRVFERGAPGRTYNIGGRSERRNIDVVRAVCALLDEMAPDPGMASHERLITHVADRPGHDLRYAIDASRIEQELGWHASVNFETGLRATVQWYLSNPGWVERARAGSYQGQRLGLGSREMAQ